MILLPPRSTRTATLFPYSTLFRSVASCDQSRHHLYAAEQCWHVGCRIICQASRTPVPCRTGGRTEPGARERLKTAATLAGSNDGFSGRCSRLTSEERRVRTEWVSTVTCRGWTYHDKKNNGNNTNTII